MSPWFPVFAILVLVTAWGLVRALGRTHTTAQVRCPGHKCLAEVEFSHRLEGPWGDGGLLGVRRCSLLPAPGSIACGRECEVGFVAERALRTRS
jgi:hypothetical protein